jgi:hypothetical protein
MDEKRASLVKMEKPCPASGSVRLRVGGYFAAHRSSLPKRPQDIHYEIVAGDDAVLRLEDAQWADWTSDGRLLVATRDGRLQIRDRSRHRAITFDADLATLTPAPVAPPDQAHLW